MKQLKECVDTHTDGNKFLQIFDNSKEIRE